MLEEDWSSDPCTQVGWLTTAYNSMGYNVLSWPLGYPPTCTHTYTDTDRNIHTHCCETKRYLGRQQHTYSHNRPKSGCHWRSNELYWSYLQEYGWGAEMTQNNWLTKANPAWVTAHKAGNLKSTAQPTGSSASLCFFQSARLSPNLLFRLCSFDGDSQ